MKANRKFKEEEAVSAVIGVILMVAITVAIAATVYVYVSGIIGPSTTEQENASVTAEITGNDFIKLILAKGGQNYDTTNGYNASNINIYVEGTAVTGITDWKTGQQFLIGNATAPAVGSAVALTSGTYSVTVSILDTVVYDGDLDVT
jgi:flagellin-like protein